MKTVHTDRFYLMPLFYAAMVAISIDSGFSAFQNQSWFRGGLAVFVGVGFAWFFVRRVFQIMAARKNGADPTVVRVQIKDEGSVG